MAEAIRGLPGSGSVVTYQVPRDHSAQIDLIYFVLTCDATAGIHKARVRFVDATISQTVATLRDLNEGGASEVLTYTYGIGLNASACVTVTGWDITDALPRTTLAPETSVYLEAVNDAGALIAGDAFASVVLYVDLIDSVAGSGEDVTLIPGLLPA